MISFYAVHFDIGINSNFNNIFMFINFKGIEDREGLFDTIKRNMTHHQKRAYQCIKFMVNLFNICQTASNMLQSNGDLKRKWISAVNWLNKELEKVGTLKKKIFSKIPGHLH